MPVRRPHRGFHASIRSRELGLTDHMPSIAPLLGGFRTTPEDEYAFWTLTPSGDPAAVPPFSAAFSTTALNGHAVLTADEDGILTILDTRRSLRDQMHHAEPSHAPPARFRAHDNAIFDAVWLANDTRVASASGDASVRVFDPTTLFRVALLRGATGTVKCVRALPESRSVLASCGRDGAVRLHDLRVPAVYDPSVCREVFHRPVFTIDRAHAPAPPPAPVAKRRRVMPDAAAASVTSLAVLSDGSLFTAGAADGTVKQWDLRTGGGQGRPGKLSKRMPTADVVASATPSAEGAAGSLDGRRRHGVAFLDVDPSGTRLLASCTDSTIHLYHARDLALGRDRLLSGRAATSFYQRSRFSPCGQFVASGSADSKAYIWEVGPGSGGWSSRGPSRCGGGETDWGADGDLCGEGERPVLELDGHRGGELSVVEWCTADPFKMVTCADDSTVKLWSVDTMRRAEREREEDERPCGAARRVGPVCAGGKSPAGAPTGRTRAEARRFRDSDIRSFFGGSPASSSGGGGGSVMAGRTGANRLKRAGAPV